MRRVVALSGKRFAGKDTLAGEVVVQAAARGALVELFAFAAESKRMFAAWQAARGVEVSLAGLLADRAYKELWRPRLTEFTLAALREDPLVFCRAVADRMAAARGFAIVTDLRLRSEVIHLRSRFELWVVRVTRSSALREASGWRYTPGVDDHSTETELDDPGLWDEEFLNDGTRAQLGSRVAGRVMGWLGPCGNAPGADGPQAR